MRNKTDSVDKVRASRDGHEYHEAWTARRALELLGPDSTLKAIAVEGLSPADQREASAETVEIADITLYYGQLTFGEAERTTIAQFKYSVADGNTAFRASHAKKTVAKFAKTYLDYKKEYGSKAVRAKLDFELVTNRPILTALRQGIDSLATGVQMTNDAKNQADQIRIASRLFGADLAEFAAKLKIVGVAGTLPAVKNELTSVIVDWSATQDPIARARLGQLRQVVRDKAGHAGTGQNLITRPDILAALSINDADDLLPCRPAIPEIGNVVERTQLAAASALVPNLSIPLLIHAAGGVGKTVFLTSLASIVGEHSEVVFFDCFGGGAYRSPEDARHQPRKGLIHIVNTLAFRGLCDPILPHATDVDSLLRTFRRRLIQCVNTLHRIKPGRSLAIFIDAIDNAERFARARDERAFPTLLLESLHHESIPGVMLIVSCRSERKPDTYAKYALLELQPFTEIETTAFLGARLTNVSAIEIKVAQARSAGNPRVLDYLVKSGAGLLDESEMNKPLVLDDLIQKRISNALASAFEQGYAQKDVDAFLAGLSVLPPPVPINEYAGAHGMQLQEIESFAADLSPLLERTGQGLMFRDEPTETFISSRYASAPTALRRVAKNLLALQDTSVYAARALPGLLHQLGDGEQLFKLAFDERIPAAISSTVGKRNVRYARIKAAVLHSAIKRDYNHLVELLVELSTLAAVDQRGENFLLSNPDLVVAAQDVDSARRLFETRTSWPGERHARLAIANTLLGELGEATRHAIAANEWIDHDRGNDREDRAHPERPDIAAIAFFLICQGRPHNASEFLKRWYEWYAFEVSSHIFEYLGLAIQRRRIQPRTLFAFCDCLTDVGLLAGALAFGDLPAPSQKNLATKLSKACKRTTRLQVGDSYRLGYAYQIQDGLRIGAALSLSFGHAKDALAIARCIREGRPSLWSLRDDWYYRDVFPFIYRVALESAATGRPLHEKDVLPEELAQICKPLRRNLTGKAFRDQVKQRLPKALLKKPQQQEPIPLGRDEIQNGEVFLDRQLELLLALTRAFSDFLSIRGKTLDKAFVRLLTVWEEARARYDTFRSAKFDNFFRNLGLQTALFGLCVRKELKVDSVTRFLNVAHAQDIGAECLIQVISILARRTPLHVLAGEQALKARILIETENDVAKRATLLADLARAVLPMSIDDATVYFRDGLEQMDAIGSDDSAFVNELLLFASTIKGAELDERDCHTLGNICELNMGEEPQKFYWGAFARGMSKSTGLRGLAKLSRWDDRSKIGLQNTLLPYLTALVEDSKIEPDLALALNRLAKPIEYFADGTKAFAEAIEHRAEIQPSVMAELIKQFEDDNPGTPSEKTLEVLASIAGRTLGSQSAITRYLTAAQARFKIVHATKNKHRNYSGSKDIRQEARLQAEDRDNRTAISAIATATNPLDRQSLSEGIEALNHLERIWGLKDGFFVSLRAKVPFASRLQYIRNICESEQLSLNSKLEELTACKNAWEASSAALGAALREAAIPLIHDHAEDLVDYGRFSGYNLQQISNLSGVASGELVLALIKVFARPDASASGSVWLSFASFISPNADDGHCQDALHRLLASDSARLADNVVDGPWHADLHSIADSTEFTSGIVWRMLGSPYAHDRWRATHSIRCLARFDRWDVVDSLVKRIDTTGAGPYQARELPFYHLHARLWLLIALARMALDHPKYVARYKEALLQIVIETSTPHVLMRHFASRTLIACIEAGEAAVLSEQEKTVRTADLSPHARMKKNMRQESDFYHRRPASAPEPAFNFNLDYDFHKSDVDNLSHVFGKPCWEIEDMLSEIVQKLDPNVTSMYDGGGRPLPNRSFRGMNGEHQSYGQHLGWHALLIAAGQLLRDHPVTNDWWYEEDPWGEWLGRYRNTLQDGYWLSDGVDITPLDATTTLLEPTQDGLVLTGDKGKLMQLTGLGPHVKKELIVYGRWKSPDGIRVGISSALLPPSQAVRLVRRLLRENPMMVCVPTYEVNEEDGEYLKEKQNPYTPWIVCPSGETRLDGRDPFSNRVANIRPFLSKDFASTLSLVRKDRFGRKWEGRSSTLFLRSEAWGREEDDGEGGSEPGLRLICSRAALREILKKHDKELLLLIRLQRYEKESSRANSKFTHTVAVIRISQTLEFEFYLGGVNKPHKVKY